MRHKVMSATGIAATAVLLAGCSATAVDRSGAPEVRTLVMANNDGGGLSGVPAISTFVDRLQRLSGGTVRVTVRSRWEGGGDEARVIRDVAAGKADLGWSGTRAFDLVGIDAFQPLHAPFLVSSYAAESAVVRDPVSSRLLTSLEPKGLSGLALLGDELRRPAAAAKPLLTPADFRGLRFGTPPSTVQQNGIRALGGTPVTFANPRPPDTDGLEALDTMWWTYRANSQSAFMPIITGNVALWPRTTVLFANTARLQQLDAQTRSWISQAAAAARDWSAAHAGDRERAEISEACVGGAKIATATTTQLAALRKAAEPAYAALRANRTQAATLTTLEALVGAVTPESAAPVPEGCAYTPGTTNTAPAEVKALAGPGRPGAFPKGTYRYVVTEDELRPIEGDEWARANAGVWTWTLGGGRWSYVLKQSSKNPPADYGGNTCAGYYDVSGDTISFTRTTVYAQGDCAPPTWRGRWAAVKAGVKWSRMEIDGHDLDFLFGGKVWERIG